LDRLGAAADRQREINRMEAQVAPGGDGRDDAGGVVVAIRLDGFAAARRRRIVVRMTCKWKSKSTVGAGGRVEVIVPELKPGAIVEVAVRFTDESKSADRPIGILKGKIKMSADFDAPLDDFESYISG